MNIQQNIPNWSSEPRRDSAVDQRAASQYPSQQAPHQHEPRHPEQHAHHQREPQYAGQREHRHAEQQAPHQREHRPARRAPQEHRGIDADSSAASYRRTSHAGTRHQTNGGQYIPPTGGYPDGIPACEGGLEEADTGRKSKRRIISFALSLVVIILALVLVVQTSGLVGTVNQVGQLNVQADQIKQGMADAQTVSDDLTKKKEEQAQQLLKYRNAEGRMAMIGSGTGKVCYLTFDDGPYPELTKKILDVLDENDACGTWFCMGNTKIEYIDLSLTKEIEERGNVVGIHDWNQASHYNYYRGSVQNYFDTDFDKTKKNIEKAVGHEINIMRFAGGSATIGYVNKKIGTALPTEMVSRGNQFFDWNVSAEDSNSNLFVNGSTPADTIVKNVLEGASYYAEKNSPICVLMHDNPGKDTTVEALPEIIKGLREMGYTFDVLTVDSPGFYQVDLDV